MRASVILVFVLLLGPLGCPVFGADAPNVERWGVFTATLAGPKDGDPFSDVQLSASFAHEKTTVSVHGFYDGDGLYRVRFMPDQLGQWQYVTQSNVPKLSGIRGSLNCTQPTDANHGPVRVRNVHHFAYEDGTPFVAMGTTCYGWIYEPDVIQEQTLATLKSSPFDKIRMQILPGKQPADLYPYPRDSSGRFDPSRFNPEFFQHLEKRIEQLGQQGVEADLILFHPYHKGEMEWFDDLDDTADERYLNYVVARLAAYHNVWWSLANEYGQVKHKTDADWDRFFQVVAAGDPYGHLRSIHNAAKFYDANKPWVTHASIQNGLAVSDFGRAVLYRDLIPKPVVYDEVGYEGNINARWGDLSGQELVKRFWLGTIAGTYVGHGETVSKPGGVAWTSGGGELLGTSPPRLTFLRKILEAAPPEGIEPIDEYYETHVGGKAGEYYLVYFGEESPLKRSFSLPRDPPNKTALAAGMTFKVDILDTWNMTVTPVDRQFILADVANSAYAAVGDAAVNLPGRPYIALRIQRMEN